MDKHYRIAIIGGGTAGISTASRLMREMKSLAGEIVIIDPAEKHYYQPLWTLVGGGEAKKETTERSMEELIPEGADWIKAAVISLEPEENFIRLSDETKLSYEFLVVAAGIEIHWEGIKGLSEAIGRNGVCSNYSYEYTDYTWEAIKRFKGGNAVFTHPATPIKCGGAPQKIMYLAEDYFCKTGIRDKTEVIFGSANPVIFDVEKYRKALEKVLERKKIDAKFNHNLIEVRGEQKEAVFEHLETKEKTTINYELLHVTPPMQAPSFIKNSSLADEAGWVDVHPHTLQHRKFENIFSLGDCSNLPTSKTGAAIRKQYPVTANNLVSLMKGEAPAAMYDGYSSCPLVTGYNTLILAEFNYKKEPAESFPFNQAKERRSMYIMKRDMLPIIYWNGMLKGTM